MKNTSKDESGCTMLMLVEGKNDDYFNLVVGIDTYFVNHVTIKPGNNIIAFFDSLAPMPLIFPPQFRAIVIAKKSKKRNVKFDYFNRALISSDNLLKLNVTDKTLILLENDQTFLGDIEKRNLVVVYGSSTKSIPAITTPSKIIVLCDDLCSS